MISQPLIQDGTPDENRPPIVISLFGTFEFTVNGEVVTGLRSNKTRALLAYLLLTPYPLPRAALYALLWADYVDQSAQANLRQTLANLRECLAPFDLFQGNRTQLSLRRDPALLWCDVHAFEALLDACDTHDHETLAYCPLCRPRLQAAVALYRGPLLDAFAAIDSQPFTDWLQDQRARLAERLAAAQAALAAGAIVRGNLPIPLTPLIGRSTELTQVERYLQHAVYRCVSLLGPGGIGKTRLAQAVGAQVQPAFPDGVWLVELSGLAPTTPTEPTEQLHDRLATAIAQTLGVPFYGATAPATQVANYLSHKTALLILDSFEHLTAGAAWLPPLLASAPRLRLLVTTRHRLPLQSQLVYVVEGLGVPPADRVGDPSATHLLAQYAGLQLFVERAESAGLPLPLDRTTLATVGQICRFVDGSPWAIELAVALLDRQSPAAILAAIEANYRVLTSNLLDVPLRQRSAAAVFRTAWALLTPAEAQTLARCAVFRGGFSLAAAQSVAAATPATLDALVQKSLLRTNSDDRYAMHDLVRQFAGEQLAVDAVAADRTHMAHAAYFTELLATWQPDDATEQRFRTAVAHDWANVQAAWSWAVETGQVALLQQGVAGLAEYCEIAGLYLAADRAFGAAVTRVRALLDATPATTAGAAIDKASIQTLLAHLLWRRSHFLIAAFGQLAEGKQVAEELLAWGEQLGNATLTAWGYYELNVAALFQGEYRRQEELVRQALSLAQQQGDRRAQATYLQFLAISLKMQQAFAAAAAAFEEALLLAQAVGSGRLTLMIRSNLGSFHWDAGNFTKAQAYLQQALTQAQARTQKDTATFVTACLGALAQTLGDYANAHTYCAAAHQGYIELGYKVMEAELLNLLGVLCIEMGEWAAAEDYSRRALASSAAQTYTVQRGALLIQGQLQRLAGNWAAARTAYEAAYTLSQQTHILAEWLPVQTQLAALALAQGDRTAALTALEPVLANFADAYFTVAQRPQELLLLAYQILLANADPRAPTVLHQAWALVQEQLAKIDDPRLRDTFLTNVPVNREVARLMAAGEMGR
ncbi:MAG: tetratricopeptide repeat protein [Caldilineaceae bacterium]